MNRSDDIDVLTLGETMIRYSPQGQMRLEQCQSVETHVGGSESNTAVGLARLGHRVTWLSRMTDNSLGRFISNGIAAHGVDVSRVVWTEQDRVGTYYMERGRPPRSASVIYDRAASAATRMAFGHFDQSLSHMAVPRFFHTTGITLGISPSAGETAFAFARWAKEKGAKVSFDVNYRSKLWSCEDAKSKCDRFAKLADVIFLPIRDAQGVFGVDHNEPGQVLMHLRDVWPDAETIILTLASRGSAAIDKSGEVFYQAAFPAEEVERLGGGDAFSAGCLSAILNGCATKEMLRYANAAAAVKYTIPGDFPVWDSAMIDNVLASGSNESSWR